MDRVRDALGPVRIQGRPELDALTQEGTGTSRGLVRPTMALLSYYVLTDPSVPADDRAVRAAAAVELLHLGALYHDDVVDHAHERRGRPSVNAVWGEHLAILAGDCVMLTGLNMLAQLGQCEVIEGTMANERMCAGMVTEAADLYSVSRSEQAYLDAVGGKTAHLFALACRLGAMQADRDGGRQESREALAGFGRQFGYAYQLRDDILDLTSTAEELGKPVNTGLSEGVYTLPVIRAASRDHLTLPEINAGGGPVAFSPDACTFAVGSSVYGTVGLRNVATDRTHATLTGHTDAVRAVAFSLLALRATTAPCV